MRIAATVKQNLYKDSVALMRIAQSVQTRDGVRRATLLMGTPANKDILAQAGLLREELAIARPADLMIIVEAETAAQLDAAMSDIARLLEGGRTQQGAAQAHAMPLRSIAMARAQAPEAAVAQISVPGAYAAAEAMKALRQGMHVFLFSDNVPVDEERAIKRLARDKGLLVMGPDCGTAIIRSVPLGFANVVRPGAIGLIGASGTGLQEVTCQIHALGHGVLHAIGTGGRDVSEEIGGITMRQAIDLLAADPAIAVIGIVSKPPAPAVARQIIDRAATAGKPCVVLFLGADLAAKRMPEGIVAAGTLYEAAAAAVALLERKRFDGIAQSGEWIRLADGEARRFAAGQRYLRGLYSGGTFCTEAQLAWRGLGLRVHSNAPSAKAAVPGAAASHAHTAIDLGGDEFTVGRPHPMIDPTTRIERIAQEARDPATAAIVLDAVLGYGAHDDPAGALAQAIAQAKAACAKERRHLAVVSFVCGTEDDPQRLSVQQAKLREAGAIVAPSSTAAAQLAGAIALRAQAQAGARAEMR